MPERATFRVACAQDAPCLSVLATQVFLDTYATEGVDASLANEVRSVYAPDVFATRLADPRVRIVVATNGDKLVGFVDLDSSTACPVPGIQGSELFRLYVQAPFQRRGIGRALLAGAEREVSRSGVAWVWLQTWAGNARALAFYRAQGYAAVGAATCVIEGKAYDNRVFAKRLGPHPA